MYSITQVADASSGAAPRRRMRGMHPSSSGAGRAAAAEEPSEHEVRSSLGSRTRVAEVLARAELARGWLAGRRSGRRAFYCRPTGAREDSSGTLPTGAREDTCVEESYSTALARIQPDSLYS